MSLPRRNSWDMEELGFEPCRHREHGHEYKEPLPGEADMLTEEAGGPAMNKVLCNCALCQVAPGGALCPRVASRARRSTRSSAGDEGGQGPRGPEKEEVLRDL